MGNEQERAFREWIHAAEQHTWDNFDLWKAACDYQRESDAKICDEVEKLLAKRGSHEDYGDVVAYNLSLDIRNNK